MTGSNPFLINRGNEDFQRSLKRLYKATAKGSQQVLIDKLEAIILELTSDPRPQNSRQEPVPSKVTLPPLNEFRKIDFSIAKGASGQIRLMYLLDISQHAITALWIYSHEQFSTRPKDKDIGRVIKSAGI